MLFMKHTTFLQLEFTFSILGNDYHSHTSRGPIVLTMLHLIFCLFG
uniref:Uncharacterized protein n=1 Tax=Lotus japonicus TaxID=34305 RepID=I3SNH8_LOTJA|nr:unknown [Lotus japonicus]